MGYGGGPNDAPYHYHSFVSVVIAEQHRGADCETTIQDLRFSYLANAVW